MDISLGDNHALRDKDWLHESLDIMKSLKENLERAQNQLKMDVDWHMVEKSFEVGDLV